MHTVLTIWGADGEPDGEDDREKVMGMGEIVGRCVSPVCVSVSVCLSVCQCSVCVCGWGGGGGGGGTTQSEAGMD